MPIISPINSVIEYQVIELISLIFSGANTEYENAPFQGVSTILVTD
jgi:hypothetical protein